jgi:hypothetical protein
MLLECIFATVVYSLDVLQHNTRYKIVPSAWKAVDEIKSTRNKQGQKYQYIDTVR